MSQKVVQLLLGGVTVLATLGGVGWFVWKQQGDAGKIDWLRGLETSLDSGEVIRIPGLTSFTEAAGILMNRTEEKAQAFFVTDFDRKGAPSKYADFMSFVDDRKRKAWFLDARVNVEEVAKVSVWSFEPWRKGHPEAPGTPHGARIVMRPPRHDEKKEEIEENQYVEMRKKYWADEKEKERREDELADLEDEDEKEERDEL